MKNELTEGFPKKERIVRGRGVFKAKMSMESLKALRAFHLCTPSEMAERKWTHKSSQRNEDVCICYNKKENGSQTSL